ncbi:hypothetical protein ZIOFF_009119 [Zingiber officinale]|uniref:Uncharacterized protein n=2 Tax=Zingiber officinale TaxID=94328 RepID=A0A8J5HX01_ZINOF|nr:hypothetical protein ZIOFF_009119 [Zingiber officinale]
MSTMAVSRGVVGRSSLNPNAPLFVPMLFQQVEDFSPEWWELVQTTPWFRDHWFHQYQEQEMFDGEDSFDFGLTELPEVLDIDLDGAGFSEHVEMDKTISGATKKHDKHLFPKEFETDTLKALMLNLSSKSPKNGARPLSVLDKHREKPVQCVSPKFGPRRIIHQPR